MKRHVWGYSNRTDEYRVLFEECANCGAERLKGHWHNLKRRSRSGEWRKWRAPGSIRNGASLCPGRRKEEAWTSTRPTMPR